MRYPKNNLIINNCIKIAKNKKTYHIIVACKKADLKIVKIQLDNVINEKINKRIGVIIPTKINNLILHPSGKYQLSKYIYFIYMAYIESIKKKFMEKYKFYIGEKIAHQ